MASINIRPLGDRVVVEPLEAKDTTKSGLIIPDSAKEKPQEAKIIAVGAGKLDDKGNRIPVSVKKGEVVLVSKYGGTEIKIDGGTYQIFREDDILAIIG